jgi:AGCS family alanine or glycine:cation symporter
MELLVKALDFYNNHIGPYALILLLLPTGLFFTIALKFIQFRRLGHAFSIVSGRYDDPKDEGDISHFQALCAALSATVGIGNIVGVALAIHLGGPGAIFWMWVTGLLGMALKYTECTLALKYRDVHDDGSVSGGPMYYMRKALAAKYGKPAIVMGVIFASAGVICSWGTGNMAQSNSMADALRASYSIPTWVSGLAIAGVVFLVIVGGIKRIGAVASKLVPFMAAFYVISALAVIFINARLIPDAFALIFEDAFTGRAAGGGFFWTMIWGVRRGLFSNEAGQGSAPIAHAAAKTKWPVREGLVAMAEPFIDTLVICTMTALVVVLCGKYGTLKGAPLTTQAFTEGLAAVGLGTLGTHVVTIGTVLFALSTAISWSYYGDRCLEFLVKHPKVVITYRVMFCVFLFIGAIWKLTLVWAFVDVVITFMAIPNLIALLLLRKEILQITKDYFSRKHVPYKKRAQQQ